MLVHFFISRYCDTYSACQAEVTQFLAVAVVAIIYINESKMELF